MIVSLFHITTEFLVGVGVLQLFMQFALVVHINVGM
jgi:hypothetical protein